MPTSRVKKASTKRDGFELVSNKKEEPYCGFRFVALVAEPFLSFQVLLTPPE